MLASSLVTGEDVFSII